MISRWPFARRRARTERLDPQSAYSLWASSYEPRPHNGLMEIEQQTVFDLLPAVAGKTILDAGCGSGRYLQALRGRGARLLGIDLSEAMLERARRQRADVARADFRALPFKSETIDLVICSLALGDIAELDQALGEIARVMRPGSHTIYSVVHPSGEASGWLRTFESGGKNWAVDGYWHSAAHHRRACAAANLAIEEWREPEAIGRPGQPAVLVVRARRCADERGSAH